MNGSDASGYLAEKLRHLRQLLPDSFGSTEKGDTAPRGRVPDFRSRLRPGVNGEETGDGKPDGPTDRTSAATPVIEEDDVRTLWVDTDSHGNRVKPSRDAVFESHTTNCSTLDLDAPPIAVDSCRYTSREYRDVRRWLSDRKRNQKLDDNERVCHETWVLVDIVYYGLRFDQLNAGSWGVFELACRRIQGAISACSNPKKVNWSTARLMTVAASVDDGLQPFHCFLVTGRVVHVRSMSWTCFEVGRQESRWVQVEASMELTLALTTRQANLPWRCEEGGRKPGPFRTPQATAGEP